MIPDRRLIDLEHSLNNLAKLIVVKAAMWRRPQAFSACDSQG
jgi:hypothetical protein